MPTTLPSVQDYAEAFRLMASESSWLGIAHVDACISYATKLLESGLPVIFEVEHLSALVGLSADFVRGAAFDSARFYRVFSITKKNGGVRNISEPLPGLKAIQRWINSELLCRVEISPYAKAYAPGSSVKENAKFHRGQAVVLRLDLKDFFPSIERNRVFGLFRRLGYSSSVSGILSRLCTVSDALPQGAPTSPAISNLICRRLDRRLFAIARRFELRFTRYADDLIFSGARISPSFLSIADAIIRHEGFVVNSDKTRIMRQNQRQLVTGVVVNSAMNVERSVRRSVRQACHYIKRYGVDGHLAHLEEKRGNFEAHIRGHASHILSVNPADRDSKELISIFSDSGKNS